MYNELVYIILLLYIYYDYILSLLIMQFLYPRKIILKINKNLENLYM